MFDFLSGSMANLTTFFEGAGKGGDKPKNASQPPTPRGGGPDKDGGGQPESLSQLFAGLVDDPTVAGARLGMAGDLADGVLPQVAAQPVKALAPDEQAKAIEGMTDKEFNAYLQSIPGGDTKAQLEAIEKMKSDPKRKLMVWAAVHGAEVEKDLDADLAESGTSEQDLDALFRRVNTNNETKVEIADEKQFLEDKLKKIDLSDPDALKKMNDEIDEMIARKEKEHEIERKYNVNITNDRGTADDLRGELGIDRDHAGVRADGSKVVWTAKELDILDASLEDLPQNQKHDGKIGMEDAMKTTEFHRGIENKKKSTDDNGNEVIEHDNAENFANGKINVYDNSTADTGKVDSSRTGRWNRDMQDPDFIQRHGSEVLFMERVITHEMGHSVHNARPEELEKYQELLKDRPGGAQAPEWFAQHYMRAIKNPELQAQVLLDDDKENLRKHQEQLAKETDPAKRAELEKQIEQDEFDAKADPQLYYHMRNDVFHTDKAEDQTAQRLESMGVSLEDIEEFHRQAQRMSTPEQIERLARNFERCGGGGY